MWYPVLNAKQKQQTMIDTFGGYNHTVRPAEAEIYDMQNMTGDDFPLLSTRGKRGILPVTDEYVGHMAKDGKLLCLRDSGTDTLKLTVTEAVEAVASAPEFPESQTIQKPDVTVTVFSSGDLTKHYGSAINETREGNDSDRIRIGGAEHINDGQWLLHLPQEDVDVRAGSLLRPAALLVFGELLKNESVSGDCLTAEIELDQYAADEFLLETYFGGERYLLTEAHYVFTLQRGKAYTKSGKQFVRCTTITKTNNPNGTATLQLYLKIEDLCALYDHSNNPAQTVERSYTAGSYDPARSSVTYPAIRLETDAHWSEAEYKAQIAEADAAYQAQIAEYYANLYTTVKIREPITQDMIDEFAEKRVQIGDVTVTAHRAYMTKNGCRLEIYKPHAAIPAGAQIDTQTRFLSLCEIDQMTGTEFSSPIGVPTAEGERTMLSMGAKVVIFPDKIVVNTLERDESGTYTDCGTLELSSKLKGRTNAQDKNNLALLMMLCDTQYQYIGAPTVSKTAPQNPQNKAYWLDNSKDEAQLKVYSAAMNMWTAVDTYIKIYSPDLAAGFEAGDAVRILDGANVWTHASVRFTDDGDSRIIYDAGEEVPPEGHGVLSRGYIVVRGILTTQTGTLLFDGTDDVVMTICRTVPDLDYIVESNNRLWGCHYGKNADGQTVNEIYACKQGDPKNWFCYEGTALDSYAASLGTDGPFTGAAVYAGNPIFFKENYMHRVFGSYPANYQIYTQAVHGVQQGSARSLAVVNERLFYKAQDGIYVYDGSLPYLMSEAFGQQAYTRAIGADGNGKYYVSLEKPDGARDLMVYDLQKRMWYREDDLPVRYMIPLGHTLIAVTRDRRMLDLLGKNGEAEPDFEWYAESGNIGYAIAAKKFVGRMLWRLDLSPGAYVRVQIAYDNNRAYTDLFTSSEAGIGSVCVPVRPHRCDHFRVRICGKGAVKLISITKTIKGGSEK